MTPFPNRLTYRAQPRFILKVIGCGFQILHITGYLIDRFVLFNGTQRNIIAVLGYLTGWHKKCSHFYTVNRTDLNQWAFLSGLIHIFQMLSQKCYYYDYFRNIESVRFFLDRPNMFHKSFKRACSPGFGPCLKPEAHRMTWINLCFLRDFNYIPVFL